VEEAIFAALHGAGAEVSMVELLERLGDRGLTLSSEQTSDDAPSTHPPTLKLFQRLA